VSGGPARGRERDLTTGHLWQVDIVRLFTFVAVIIVHAIAFTELPSNHLAGGALMVLQFGRAVFFTISGFVLVHATRGSTPPAVGFWRRRLFLVGVPYAAWTAVYEVDAALTAHGSLSAAHFGTDLLTGGAEYHLYFLLVTMQLYLVFPLLLRFVRRSADRWAAVLGVVGVANVAWLAALQYVGAPRGWFGDLWPHAYQLLPTYAVFVLAGCYAAVHLPRLQALVSEQGHRLLAGAFVAAVFAELVYVSQLGSMDTRVAADVLQPAMLLTWSAAAVALYVAASRWAAGERRGLQAVAVASEISFGVYLAHPLVLQLVLARGLGNDNQSLAAPAATLVAIVATTVGSAAVALVASRSRLSLALTGRPRRTGVRPASPAFPEISKHPHKPRSTPAQILSSWTPGSELTR
jgi:peptidoglycan/LPS O-acetylase OafA/YrhL